MCWTWLGVVWMTVKLTPVSVDPTSSVIWKKPSKKITVKWMGRMGQLPPHYHPGKKHHLFWLVCWVTKWIFKCTPSYIVLWHTSFVFIALSKLKLWQKSCVQSIPSGVPYASFLLFEMLQEQINCVNPPQKPSDLIIHHCSYQGATQVAL